MADIRARTNASGARVAVIPASMATAANVEALQRLFITVWVRQEKPYDTVEMVSNITSGANGIITKNRAGLEQCFTSHFLENTITRVVNVIGHRGQPSTGQENSIASSIEAYEAGATMIENDIRLTKDGVLIVMHDATLERSTNGDGNVEAMTSAAIQRFVIDGNTAKATQPIPTLEDYFKEFKGKDVQIIIEIKSGMEALIDPLIELIKKYEMTDQVNIITFTAIQIERLKAKYPELSVGYLTSSISLSEEEPLVTVEQILEHVQKYETTFNPSYASGALGPNVMQAAWHRGVTFWPWTVNKIEDFDKYFMYGANGITTNYSYWVENYLKNVTTEQSSYSLMVGEELDIPVLTTTYSRRQSTSNKGYMTVITGNPDGISYRQGQLTATEAGEYTVIFRHASTLKSGGVYYMCSQPVTITVEAEQSDSVETTPSETTPTDPSQGTDGTTAFTILPVAAVVAVVVMSGVVVAAIVILRKKSKQS
jgi:glycerophosphoryl diester phosphodiesterase